MDTTTFFTEMYLRLHNVVFGFCWFKLRNHEEANDVTQETFLRLWVRLSEGKPVEGNVKALALTIARNVMIDALRARHGVSTVTMEDWRSIAENHHQQSADQPESERMRAILRLVGPKEREALVLHFVDGHSVRTIAELLCINNATVHRRISRAVGKIHNALCA